MATPMQHATAPRYCVAFCLAVGSVACDGAVIDTLGVLPHVSQEVEVLDRGDTD
jgi:hypothetical protein